MRNLNLHHEVAAGAVCAGTTMEDSGAIAWRALVVTAPKSQAAAASKELLETEGARPERITTPPVSGGTCAPAVAIHIVLLNLLIAFDTPIKYPGGHALNHGGLYHLAMVMVSRVGPRRDTVQYGMMLIWQVLSGGHALNHGGVRRPAMVVVSRVGPLRKTKLYRQ